MDTAKKHIDAAFALLSKIAVAGDNVELMAAARQELRKAYSALKDHKEASSDGG